MQRCDSFHGSPFISAFCPMQKRDEFGRTVGTLKMSFMLAPITDAAPGVV